MTKSVIFCGLCVIALVTTCLSNTTQTGLKDVTAIKGELEQSIANTDEASRLLISIAKDEKYTNEDRRNAIFLLAKTRTEHANKFLIDHITLHIPKEMKIFDADRFTEKPCLFALCKSDWNAAQAIFHSLNQPKSGEQIIAFSKALPLILGPSVAKAIVNQKLAEPPPSDDYRNNLSALKKAMQ